MKNEDLKQKISNLVDEYIEENGAFDKMGIYIKNNTYSNAGINTTLSRDINIDIEL